MVWRSDSIDMKHFIAKKHEPIAFGFLITLLMTFFVAGISTILAVGIDAPGLPGLWFRAWMSSWAVAFPVILFVGPVVRRILKRIIRED